jgi:hypothetical protein
MVKFPLLILQRLYWEVQGQPGILYREQPYQLFQFLVGAGDKQIFGYRYIYFYLYPYIRERLLFLLQAHKEVLNLNFNRSCHSTKKLQIVIQKYAEASHFQIKKRKGR